MSRIVFLIIFAAVKLFAAERPNILWITSEDNSPYLGCYGDKLAKTPNLDALAKNGVRYRNAFANSPVCSSARSTLIMGIYASTLGIENHRSHLAIPSNLKLYPQILREAGYYCSNNSKTDYNIWGNRQPWNESSNRAHYRNRSPGQPFFAVFNLGSSHEGSVAPRQGKTNFRISPADIKLPPYHPDTLVIRKDWANYYDQMTLMDQQAGRLLEELEKEGLADNTIVFYFSDHGGALARGKRNIHDTGTRVPLIVRFPKKYEQLAPASPGEWVDDLVSFVDFPATLFSLCGMDIPSYHQGKAFLGKHRVAAREPVFLLRARMDERYDTVRSISDGNFKYIRNYSPHRPWGQHYSYAFQVMPNIRSWHEEFIAGRCNNVQAAFWQPKPGEEFYNSNLDPYEVINQITSVEHRTKLAAMRNLLRNKILSTRDTGFIPEGMRERLAGGKTLFEYAQSDAYPLAKVIATADMASDGHTNNLEKVIEALNDKHPVVRYWAATGCLILKEKAVPAKNALLACLEDEWLDNRIIAAEALAYLGNNDASIKTIAGALENGNLYERLAAQNSLDYLVEAGLIPLEKAKQLVRSFQESEPANRIPRYLLAK